MYIYVCFYLLRVCEASGQRVYDQINNTFSRALFFGNDKKSQDKKKVLYSFSFSRLVIIHHAPVVYIIFLFKALIKKYKQLYLWLL